MENKSKDILELIEIHIVLLDLKSSFPLKLDKSFNLKALI